MTQHKPEATSNCRELHHALDATKARLHAAPLHATAGEGTVGVEAHDDDAIDAETVRRGLRFLLAERHDIEVVGKAGTMRVGVEQAERLRPDVVVIDLRLPDGSGVKACR